MHIPDGYLSPSTCVAMFAAATPFWYVASARIKKTLSMRMVPLLSVFAAFSFIIMMFNLPLPGGTTGHATGAALAAIVLGPWAAIISVSLALVIQAVFFGDGGILAIGANCFTIAIVGVFVAHYTNRLVAGKSAVDSGRRVIAAGIAGYLSINAAAFATAVLFGIQPMFFTDSNGAPLYAPYPLDIAVPAMMIGHIGIAGFAELIVTAGVIGYLQKNDISLLSIAQTGVPAGAHAAVASGWQGARRMWLVIATLLVLTPLGLIAAGTAWGEWGAEELVALDGGQTITAAPTGLLQYAAIWQAPVPDYAVSFISSEQLGYILSGVMGVGLIILTMLVSTYIAARITRRNEQSNP